MIKRFAPWLGVLLLAVVGIYVVAFGAEAFTDPGIVASVGGMVLAAVLLLVGGMRESIHVGSRTIGWNVLVGAAYVLLAATFVLAVFDASSLDGGATAWVMAGAAVIGGGSLVWFGVQVACDGRHVDIDAEPSSARLVGIALAIVVSFLAGVVLWSVVL
ncbi:hypothetical protein [Halalkalicoccus sp. NIPERK01]|uniref:hypothetical protein n=1 Tax=Halalkalicoccus sp. NIPERK01 TaxID=3053469 RepID=UPI00256EE819|nr:hypothetical protein [Halalkalicoccus sp. NIPERK01]MDL5362206.1 hypothetical protein [Halalkalicoccus sp. NIPERK01]